MDVGHVNEHLRREVDLAQVEEYQFAGEGVKTIPGKCM